MRAELDEIDPFGLPDWLGDGEVTWSATSGLRAGPRITGFLSGSAEVVLPCDLLAVDLAYPEPVVDDAVRTRAHQSWQHGQVLLLAEPGGTPVVLAVPGSGFSADLALDTVARLALAVGASAARYAVHLQLGRERR